MALDPSKLFAQLPASLRDELVDCYREIGRNYLEHRWEPAELNGGKISEVVFCIIDGALKGAFPPAASKPGNFLVACQNLEKVPSVSTRPGDRSLRVLIPRTLVALYEIRNNRGVGHVGGDVDPNAMDATAVHSAASWVMAELVRIFHGVSTADAQAAVDALVERRAPLVWVSPDASIKRVLDTTLSVPDQTLVLLYACAGWTAESDLFKWTEYSRAADFRSKVLGPLHKKRMLEYDMNGRRAVLTPNGSVYVEAIIKLAAA